MDWVGWVIDALSTGATGRASSARLAEATDCLRQFDRAMEAACRPSAGPRGEGDLASTLAEVVRQTHDPPGRLALALRQAPESSRPRPDDVPPEYFEDWLPTLPHALRRYSVIELAVHVLAAEVRARRAGSVTGVSRPQDLHAVLLLFREALRFPDHSARYMDIARRELPDVAPSLPVAASLIRSAMCVTAGRRFYRTPEIVLAILEAAADHPEHATEVARVRRLTAELLELEADRLAAAWLAAQRWAVAARQARDSLGPPLAAGREVAWAWASEALSAAVGAAEEIAAVRSSTRDKRLRSEVAKHRKAGPSRTTVERSWERTLYAVDFCKRTTSELKLVATEASEAADALASREEPSSPERTWTLHDLRVGLGIP